MGTRTLTTALPVLKELGFEEGKQGFTLPWNIDECENIEEIIYSEYQPFKYRVNNANIVKQWRGILGNTKPTRQHKAQKGYKWVVALLDFKDMEEKRAIQAGEVYQVPENRAIEGQKQGFFKIIGG